MPKKTKNPFKMGYGPELETSPELEPVAASYYLTIMNVLSWIIKLGRINVITKVSLLLSHVAVPNKYHGPC